MATDLSAHPLVAQLFGDYFTGEDFSEQANVRVFVRAPNSGPVLVPNSWGLVPEDSFARFVSTVSALLAAGYLVSVDSRVRPGNVAMVYFDLDAVEDQVERAIPEPGRISEILGASLSTFLRAKDKQNKSNLYCAVTRNASNPRSLHVYFFNMWCDSLAELRTLGNEVKERTMVSLAEVGLKLDCAPYNMGSCRWPYTYAFGSLSIAQDTRHNVVGVFSGPKLLASNCVYVKTRSPFDGDVFTGATYDQPVFPAALSALRLYRPAPGIHGRVVASVYFGRASAKPDAEMMDLTQEDSQDGVGGVPDSSVDVDIDMTDTTTILDPNELRALVNREHLGKEVANYLRVRVCNIGTDALLKMSDGRGGIILYRYTFSKLVNGGLSIDGYTPSALAAARSGRRSKQPKAESVWKWWQRKSKFYTNMDCLPFFPGKRIVIPGVVNLWSGFTAYRYMEEPWFRETTYDELVRSEDCELDFFMWYLHQVLCNKSTGMFYRFLYFLRQIILFPEQPASIIPILEGGGGIGKSSLLEWLREYVFGRTHCMVSDNIERLTTGYNNFADRVLVALIDEGGSLDDELLQRVKYASTAFERTVEKKFQDVTTTTSPLSIAISCNSVKIALQQSERRFVSNTCDPEYASGVASPARRMVINRFWTILHDKAHAEKLARAFVCLLVRFLDPEPYSLMRSEPFVSPLYVKMLRHGASSVERFIVECLETRSNMPSSYRFEYGVIDFVERHGNWGTYYPYLALTQHFRNFSDFTRIRADRAATLREFLTEQLGCVINDGPAGHVWIRWPDFDTVMAKLSTIRISFVDVNQMQYYGLPAFTIDAVGQLTSDSPAAWSELKCFLRANNADAASSSSSSFAAAPPLPPPSEEHELRVGRRPEQFFGGAPKRLRRRYDAEDFFEPYESDSDEDSDNEVRRDFMGEDYDSEPTGELCGVGDD